MTSRRSHSDILANRTGHAVWIERLRAISALTDRHVGLLFLVCVVLCFAITCVLASERPLWNDELFTLYIGKQRTISDVWATLKTGVEQLPPFFFVILHARLRRSLSSTNGIESSFSAVETVCRRVKRWQGSDCRLRWVASALLYAETRWNRLHGYRHLPLLIHHLQRAYDMRCNLNAISLTAHSAA